MVAKLPSVSPSAPPASMTALRVVSDDEWRHQNEVGVYAASTRGLVHTRSEHGLLVAPGPDARAIGGPGDGRHHVVLSRLELRALPSQTRPTGRRTLADLLDGIGLVGERGTSPEPVRFVDRPLPEWEIVVPSAADLDDLDDVAEPDERDAGVLRMTLGLDPHRALLVVRYAWEGDAPLHLQIRPLLAMRALHERGREHGAMCQVVEVRHGEARVKPRPDLPRVCFGHGGIFVGSPDWWRAPSPVEHPARPHAIAPLPFAEDLWSPGAIEALLRPGAAVHVTCALGALPDESPESILEAVAKHAEHRG